MGRFSKFNLLHGHCTLLLFLPLFTSLCAPDSMRGQQALISNMLANTFTRDGRSYPVLSHNN